MQWIDFLRPGLVAVAAAALAACSSAPWAPSPQPAPLGRADAPAGGVCNAAAAQAVRGRSADAQTVEQARVSSGARRARVLYPGQVTTKEFDAERLNLDVDAKGVILAVRCG